MSRPKKVQYYRAKNSFTVTEDGIASDSVSAGEVLHPDHPYVQRYRDHLEPTDRFGRFDVEQATAEDSELDMNGNLDGKAVAFDGYTALRVFFHNGSDCGHMGDTVTVRDSLCAVGPDANDDGWTDAGFDCHDGPHYDGFQSDGGRNLTLEHNTIRNPCGQTSTILMSTNTSGISNVTIRDNLLAGGGYTLYCNAGPDVPNETVTGNRFARTYYPRAGFWGATTGCQMADVDSGNVWDDTGVPVG
jgi:hypothetical protein